MIYLVVVLCITMAYMVVLLWRLRALKSDVGLLDYIKGLEENAKASGRLLSEADAFLAHIGEILCHMAEIVARAPGEQNTQAADDLKVLGLTLLERDGPNPFELPAAQQKLADLGARYGIEPTGGGPYDLGSFSRIARAIVAMAVRQPGAVA